MAVISGKSLLTFCQQPSPRIKGLVLLVLILMLSYSLAQFSWRLLSSPVLAPLLPAKSVNSKPPGSNGSVSSSGLAQQIPKWHLFGEFKQEEVVPEPVDLPETNLKLVLKGLIASTDPDEARAIVADPSGKENFYKIGDKLPGNAELDEIHIDRIVIKRRGRYETLKLPKESLDIASQPVTPQRTTRSGRSVQRAASTSNQNISLREYRDTLLNNPQKVADLVRINPAYKNGRFSGYKLQSGRDTKFLSRYGLKPGDVVTSVNGVTLDSPAKGFGLIKDLSSADTLDLVVDRNGIKQRFTLPVN